MFTKELRKIYFFARTPTERLPGISRPFRQGRARIVRPRPALQASCLVANETTSAGRLRPGRQTDTSRKGWPTGGTRHEAVHRVRPLRRSCSRERSMSSSSTGAFYQHSPSTEGSGPNLTSADSIDPQNSSRPQSPRSRRMELRPISQGTGGFEALGAACSPALFDQDGAQRSFRPRSRFRSSGSRLERHPMVEALW